MRRHWRSTSAANSPPMIAMREGLSRRASRPARVSEDMGPQLPLDIARRALDRLAQDVEHAVDLLVRDDERRREHALVDQRPDHQAELVAMPVDARAEVGV